MGTGCFSGGSGAEQATAATRCDSTSAGLAATIELAAAADVVANDDSACTSKDGSGDDNCCGGDDDGERSCAAVESMDKECCDSNRERCDEKCIIAAATAECEKACDSDADHDAASGHKHEHDKDGHHMASACSTHLSKAFEQYSAYLDQARCICRSILERSLPRATQCCGDQQQEKRRQGKQKAADANVGRHHHGDEHGHEHVEAETTAHGLHKLRLGHHHDHHGVKRRKDVNKAAISQDNDDIKISTVRNENESDCCGGHGDADPPLPTYKKQGVANAQAKERDVEKDAGLELISLIVDGMTCSGCGNKLERTLKAVIGVSNVRVNFVLGTAEFSLDVANAVADDVIRTAERATGFRCARVAGGRGDEVQTLDLLPTSQAAAEAFADLSVAGLGDVSYPGKEKRNLVRVAFDPSVVGARDLVAQIGDLASGLAPPRDDPSVASGRKRLFEMLVKTTVSAVLTVPVLVLTWGEETSARDVDDKTRAIVGLALATAVQLMAVPDFYYPALSALIRSRAIEMDMLVVISITAAYFYSVVAFGFRIAGRPLETAEFFETSTLLITLMLLGRLVAAFARIRAVAAVSVRSLQAATAIIVGKDDCEEPIDARLLQFGDRFKVLPHSAIPTDGIIVSGTSEVDESMLTGEAAPVPKAPGDSLVAGTVNGSGTLLARLSRLPGRNTVTDIAEMVEDAARSKPRIQETADRVASWFVPVVTTIAVLVIIIWTVVGLKGRSWSAGRSVANAVTYAVAVLAISCPCALGLAVPMVLVIAGGIAARGGVIIKSAECTERARLVEHVVFDKTGTITEPDLDVIEEYYPESVAVSPDEAVFIAKALTNGNTHPVSVAVAKHLNRFAKPITAGAAIVEDIRVVSGSGVEAVSNGQPVRAGNPLWTEMTSHPSVAAMQESGMTLLVVTFAYLPIAIFGLRTRIRPGAAEVVARLQQRGIAVHLVSGDQVRAVHTVALQVGIPPSNVRAQHSPAQKRDYVATLMAGSPDSKKKPVVMFVGDGTNDAVAVVQADVGVQLAGGSGGKGDASASDVTRGAADVVLLSGLDGVTFLLDLSRAAFRRMLFNFIWSAVYNVVAILLASGAFVNVRIEPRYAGLGEIVSVLPVIFAASTLLMKKI
ncbi:E1-E2 ATPase-domain-containing protein [Triangularia verruculosa]|uniref:E1-E2 ATPase-domain-containing protein n=1 Tax=Triangularia verruculosa TaxID=2587418 RepID=A0AAN6X582_9PEZI|nr:E1-E2 ATPase-domain-containing protein [Triangularia verruculosa]